MEQSEQYAFTINEVDQQTFWFDVDGNGRPIKLGDGSFGVVYRVHDRNDVRYAVKLLYIKQTVAQLSSFQLTESMIDAFQQQFNLPDDNSIMTKLRPIQGPSIGFVGLLLALKGLDLTDVQLIFLLKQIEHNNQSIAVQRFRFEMNSVRTITTSLRDQGMAGNIVPGVIEIKGGTEHFRASSAYKELAHEFDQLQTKVSDYAEVMPLYQWTLKDILEKGTEKYSNPQEHAAADAGNLRRLNGYDILRSMDFKARIATVLPYLFDIAQGLIALHRAGQPHLDIKPGNIFVRENGRILDVVIGDLGFMNTPSFLETSAWRYDEVLPLGTRHYRSPEQKDYFDICDVEVVHRVEAEGGRMIVELIVRDPKFVDSIIEPGDALVFGKDSQYLRYIIADIRSDTSAGTQVITLSENAGETPLSSVIVPDSRTLVFFYKLPAIRTDLFGIGAIIFDLLTCGKSPERFYDGIRNYDAEDQQIDKIVDSYRGVATFQSSELELITVFAPFRDQQTGRYAPEALVALILRCMMYKAKGTFFQQNREAARADHDSSHAMQAVFAALNDLKRVLNIAEERIDNALIQGRLMLPLVRDYSLFSDKLTDLQRLPPSSLLRLAHGIWHLQRLATLVRDSLSSEHARAYFVQMLPENITIAESSRDSGFVLTAYKTLEHYQADLRNDLVYTKVTRDTANPYVPDTMAYLRRFIQLTPIDAAAVPAGGQANMPIVDIPVARTRRYSYIFAGSSPLGDVVRVGDWVVMHRELWRVRSTDTAKREVLLEHLPEGTTIPETEIPVVDLQPANGRSVYYHTIDPCSYYLSMIGIYLYQLFFVGMNGSTHNKPLVTSYALSAHYYRQPEKAVSIKPFRHRAGDPIKRFDQIFQFIAQMYVKATFGDDAFAYCQLRSSDLNRINLVLEDAEELQRMIEKFFGLDVRTLDTLISNADAESCEAKRNPLLSLNPKDIQFDNLVFSQLNISVNGGWRF